MKTAVELLIQTVSLIHKPLSLCYYKDSLLFPSDAIHGPDLAYHDIKNAADNKRIIVKQGTKLFGDLPPGTFFLHCSSALLESGCLSPVPSPPLAG